MHCSSQYSYFSIIIIIMKENHSFLYLFRAVIVGNYEFAVHLHPKPKEASIHLTLQTNPNRLAALCIFLG